ncbi:alanine racemase [Burkholderia gladioli]|jgi:alanine racemase|uniref:Alanine racemase n=1 Tax=Burkholderia gladioli TaxID=28095 RepID=A0AAP1USQ8_BURGA|nr:alanine racemase [Burkholderia gladioli]AJW95225.1 alanine racemase [Burkholderia gladioli]ASD84177.1 alanine racemase [Burkholderia gladioli pv. gladioli]AWY51598.1 alanine racemase [Burkholderia gladioli pv. gladioli]KGC13450.1 alanine racemase [Burkholderia gladioli]MBA1362868.1 alanine racemase [Burkholderia gladioli]
MPRPILAQIRPAAVRHNLAVIRRRAASSRVWAVVKANAYGHGIERIYPGLAEADGIALLDLDEAVRVRELGWTRPVLLLEGLFEAADVAIADRYRLSVAVHTPEQLDMLAAARPTRPIDIQLKMNSGMNRLGFRPDVYREAWQRASATPAVGRIALMMHFANADEGQADWQMQVFDAATQGLPGERTLSNSAGVLWHPAAHRDWVRPGTILYGASPTGVARDIADTGLLPSMTLSSRLIGIQTIEANETVGYGRRFAASSAMRVGVVACGYADGYPRHAPTGTPIVVDGVRTRVVGRVSMDMLTVDLTPCPNARIGSPVELWGNQVHVDEVAEAASTIGYELICAIARRVPVEVEPLVDTEPLELPALRTGSYGR